MALSLRGLVSKVGALALVAALQMATAQTSSESKARPKAEMERLAIEASAVKSRHAKELMDLPAVVGHGVGLSKKAPRKPAIEVYVSRKLTEEERKKFPENLEGVPVVILETGEFHALPKGKKETKKPSQQKSTAPAGRVEPVKSQPTGKLKPCPKCAVSARIRSGNRSTKRS